MQPTAAVPSFIDELDAVPVVELAARSRSATPADVERSLHRATEGQGDLVDFATLLSPAASIELEAIARAAHTVTRRRFGHTIHLFAPLYLSNDCLSTCTYCGFSKHLDVRRRTLSPDLVAREAQHLEAEGFRHLLLVSAEHQRDVGIDYLAGCIARVHELVASVSIETQVWGTDEYRALARAGCEGVVIYQETYDRLTYAEVHTAGKKRDYDFRLGGPERAAEAGIRRIGVGALFGLHADWRAEALALAAHAQWLLRAHWQAEVTVAFPRIQPSASGFAPRSMVDDRDFALLTAATRLFLHDIGIVLSTREPARLRDGLIEMGVTHISAGSSTEPGGYVEPGEAEEQFSISDTRSPETVANVLRVRGLDPVWKDWSPAMSADRLARL